MKIGKFSTINNLSIDTIRHYMDLGLIIPEKQRVHYDFDDRCQKDLADILELKEMGFTLQQIKSFFLFKRLGKLTVDQQDAFYQEFFHNHYHKINNEIIHLSYVKIKLEEKLKDLSSKQYREPMKMGIDLGCLHYFTCHKCSQGLRLVEGNIINDQVVKGRLRCICGNEYSIVDGILYVGGNGDSIDEDLDYPIHDYIKETDEHYLENVYKGLEWIHKRLDFGKFKNKVILDLGSGAGFLLRTIYDELPENTLYIAIDHDYRRHRFLKSMLEKAEGQKKVVFICSDFLQIPIKDQSVDILFDGSGSSNYAFKHEEFLLKPMDRYIKEDGHLIGSYILFKNFSMNSFIENRFRKNFILRNIQQEIKNLKYKLLDERISDYLDQGGKYESYFRKGEKVYTYIFYGKR